METVDLTKLDLGSFGFTPDWAKKDAGVSIGKMRNEAHEGDARGPRSRQDREGGRPFGERKPFAERSARPAAKPRFQERPRPLDVDVKVLPDPKALGTVFRKIQQGSFAYKLKDLAYFILENPSSVLLKITPKASAEGRPAEGLRFVQCKACGFASTDEADVISHILTTHLSDYYDAKEIEVDPPKGNFNCVAKCGLSGVLLGPPNIHEFNATVREMIRTRYPEMTEEQYRQHIEMVRDAEAIEAWRKGATKRTVFTAKGAGEDALVLTREQAEGEFRRTILPTLVDRPKQLMITAEVAMNSPVKPLVWAARDALEAERRSPYGMCFALRGAFHHRKLKFFRVNDARGQEFVTNVEYRPFDAEHAIADLAKVAKFVADNPCCSKSEICADEEGAKHLAWLVSTGHVVSFVNGVFSPVEKYPKYGPQWRKRKSAPKGEARPAEAADAVEVKVEEKKEEQSHETAPELAE